MEPPSKELQDAWEKTLAIDAKYLALKEKYEDLQKEHWMYKQQVKHQVQLLLKAVSG